MIESIAIPPPPPPSELSNSSIKSSHVREEKRIPFFKNDLCLWAVDYPDIQQACCLAHICTHSKPKMVRFKTNIRAITQNGPTCGLTALTMLTDGSLTADDILSLARNYKYTNHGEMFSTKNMGKLAEDVFEKLGMSHRINIFSGQLNCGVIRENLKNGACIMVAYDSDFNHSPCLKNGHKAHWALIVGCLLDEKDKFHVFVRHGKTKNLALWPLEKLSQSNSNLNEYIVPHRYNDYSFKMPVGGIAGENGLKEQCVILENIQNNDEIFCSFSDKNEML